MRFRRYSVSGNIGVDQTGAENHERDTGQLRIDHSRKEEREEYSIRAKKEAMLVFWCVKCAREDR
jgi:hypothetical protein